MITIIKGGNSAERNISLLTGNSIAQALTRLHLDFIEVDAAEPDWLEQVLTSKPTIAVLALHGPFGEDGTIQKILDAHHILYTGSGPEVSALTIDKINTKERISTAFDIAVPKSFSEHDHITISVVVKPNKNGSSYGISIVTDPNKLPAAIAFAKKYDEDSICLIEERIDGIELTCGVLDIFGELTALPLVEIVPGSEFFDFNAKYNGESGCQEICPARIPQAITEEIQRKSKELFTGFGISQYCRIDWILRNDIPYFLEINTLPGMTPTSLIIKELAAEKISYDDFIKRLVKN